MKNFTPGPWGITTYHEVPGDERGYLIYGNREEIAKIPLKKADDIKPMANTHLIAAAPDLLEACKYVVNYHRENDSGEGELFGLDLVTTCIEAIRKAEL